MAAKQWNSAIAAVLLLFGVQEAWALPFTNVYILGDSLSDQGNLKAATTAAAGSANSVPASDHYFAGRFSNGPVYTDFLSARLGIPIFPSIAGGSNFAYGGARTDYNVAEARAGGPLPNDLFPWALSDQVAAFRATGTKDPHALYVVFSGSNDVADILRNRLDPTVVVPRALDVIVDAVEAFKEAGARRVVVGNVADLGLTPAFLALGPTISGLATGLSEGFNAALDARLASISGIDVIDLDLFGFMRELVANPAAAGLTDVTTACYSGFVVPNPSGTECSDPDAHLFWDAVHPTTVVHALLADRLLSQIPEPGTLLLMVPALIALARLRRIV